MHHADELGSGRRASTAGDLTVRAGVYDPTARPPTLRVVDMTPQPLGAGELRIDVRVVPISPYWLDMSPTPFVPGWVVAGEVAELGAGVTRYQVGQRVVAMHRMGGLAESVVLPRTAVHAIPDDLSYTSAVFMSAGLKASFVVDELRSKIHRTAPSPVVAVVHDGTAFASVIAGLMRECGAHVIGIAPAPSTVETQRSIGFHQAMDLDHESVEQGVLRLTDGHGVDGLVDHVGHLSLDTAWRVLRPGGCFLRCHARRTPLPVPSATASRRFTDLGASLVEFAGVETAARHVDEMPRRISSLMRVLRDGLITFQTVEIPFAEMAVVPELLRSRTVVGSVVVTR